MKLLIAHGAKVNATDADGDSALDQAVCSQNLESMELLLAAGATSPRALDHAKRYLAKAELELERHRAFRDFYTAQEQREHQVERDSMLAVLKAEYPNIDWERDLHDEAITLARQVLAKVAAM